MNTLLKELLARGYTIEKEDRYHSNAMVIRGYGHEFGFRIREPSVMVQRMDTCYHRMRREYDPSGRIQLEVEGFGSWPSRIGSATSRHRCSRRSMPPDGRKQHGKRGSDGARPSSCREGSTSLGEG